jgi:TM2 domain-containing membrane protein YozV
MAKRKELDEKYCADCGEIINKEAEICPKCGIRQLPPPDFSASKPNSKNKTTAAVFSLLLGWFGAHKFYLGEIGQGIGYLIFSFTLIPLIMSIVEFFIFLSMSPEVFNEKYNSGKPLKYVSPYEMTEEKRKQNQKSWNA